jgi:hypothetical protein
MTFDRKTFFSFIIKTNGDVVPAMPDEEEFSVQQIRDHVAGRPEVICETCDGFLLFRNRDANTEGLPVNPLASSVYARYTRRPCLVSGRVFLAHPEHVPHYWRKALHAGTDPKPQVA